jgi:precorrin-6A/cobalt-precorrin-6A reductase
MILLLGGTSDARPIAWRLVEAGLRVLVSQASDVPLDVGTHPNIESRSGRLDEQSLAALIDARGIQAIVDATHPYATVIHAAAHRVAAAKGIPCFRFVRPTVIKVGTPGAEFAPDHAAAAVAAFCRGRPVLLTTGTKHLMPYVEESRRTGLSLVVRALDDRASLDACRRAGVPAEQIIAGRGPFSVEANRQQLRAFAIGVLVMKDSGAAGGTSEKLQAARSEGCEVIVIARPAADDEGAFSELETLAAALANFRTEGDCNVS